jgi:hypothetical protein
MSYHKLLIILLGMSLIACESENVQEPAGQQDATPPVAGEAAPTEGAQPATTPVLTSPLTEILYPSGGVSERSTTVTPEIPDVGIPEGGQFSCKDCPATHTCDEIVGECVSPGERPLSPKSDIVNPSIPRSTQETTTEQTRQDGPLASQPGLLGPEPVEYDLDDNPFAKGSGSTLVAGRYDAAGRLAIMAKPADCSRFGNVDRCRERGGDQFRVLGRITGARCGSDPAMVYDPVENRTYIACVRTNRKIIVYKIWNIDQLFMQRRRDEDGLPRTASITMEDISTSAIAQLAGGMTPKALFEPTTKTLLFFTQSKGGRVVIYFKRPGSGWKTGTRTHELVLGDTAAAMGLDVALHPNAHEVWITARSKGEYYPSYSFSHEKNFLIGFKKHGDGVVNNTVTRAYLWRLQITNGGMRFGAESIADEHGIMKANGRLQELGEARTQPVLLRKDDGLRVVTRVDGFYPSNTAQRRAAIAAWDVNQETLTGTLLWDAPLDNVDGALSRMGTVPLAGEARSLLWLTAGAPRSGEDRILSALEPKTGMGHYLTYFGITTHTPPVFAIDPTTSGSNPTVMALIRTGTTLSCIRTPASLGTPAQLVTDTGPATAGHDSDAKVRELRDPIPTETLGADFAWRGTPAMIFNGWAPRWE